MEYLNDPLYDVINMEIIRKYEDHWRKKVVYNALVHYNTYLLIRMINDEYSTFTGTYRIVLFKAGNIIGELDELGRNTEKEDFTISTILRLGGLCFHFRIHEATYDIIITYVDNSKTLCYDGNNSNIVEDIKQIIETQRLVWNI